MPKDEYLPGKRKDVVRAAKIIEKNLNHPDRFFSRAWETSDEIKARRVSDLINRFNTNVGSNNSTAESMTARFYVGEYDFQLDPALIDVFRPVLPEIAAGLVDKIPHPGMIFTTDEVVITVPTIDFLRLAAYHNFDPSRKIDVAKPIFAEQWREFSQGKSGSDPKSR